VVRVADGHGAMWTKAFAIADDYEDADGEHVLTFWQAQDKARSLARGQDTKAGKPGTLAEALDDYESNLKARSGDPTNATRVRRHLSQALLSKPIALLTAKELTRWRDGLIERGGMKPATARRTATVVKAALNFAADHDPRISNRDAWRVGLKGASLGNTANPRNVVLSDDEIRKIIDIAWSLDPAFGLFVEVCAVTGSRPGQIARLVVADLLDDGPEPRLSMPSSKKGGRGRQITRRPIPIPVSLAVKLREAAAGLPATAKLLRRADGLPWWHSRSYGRPFAEVADSLGLSGVTCYSLRHSSITRQIKAGVPLRIIVAVHDTARSKSSARILSTLSTTPTR
jgi:integrase